ncbi:SDR family oxidoreductase [Humibacter sp. RRB41]|uniref:SDR family oxidoreductase n=1 Tax=Humibacter sp. RRB41 TaxID=2919946 RepID=UPI001FA9F779|nr:SDR family oxidoreductase [Humibacter sp. RRB41]
MQVFITGGSGQTGPAVVAELRAAGHTVTALARSDASARALEALGATPVRGSLEDLDVLAEAAAAADGVIHMAYGGDFADPEPMMRRDVDAITALGTALVGTDKPLVITSGTLVMQVGREGTEDHEPDRNGLAPFRIAGEDACFSFADRGVRASVVRLAPTVHGPDDHGFVPMLIGIARKTGISAYIGDGGNRWPAVHRSDAAVLFRLALENGRPGSIYHAVAETVPFNAIAETIGRGLNLPTASLSAEVAAAHFASPFMAMIYGADVPASGTLTKQRLGWTPAGVALLEDLEDGDYLDGR